MKNRVKEIRDQRGWSQEKLARSVNVSRQTIINIENHNSMRQVMIILEIAEKLGTTVEEMFNDKEMNDE